MNPLKKCFILLFLFLIPIFSFASSVETYVFNVSRGSWDLLKTVSDDSQDGGFQTDGHAPGRLASPKNMGLDADFDLPPPPPHEPPGGWFQKVGTFFWDVISHNKINDDLSILRADILPSGEKESINLSAWQNRSGKLVRKIFYDSFHSTVSDFSYYISFFSDGVPAAGRGKFLSGLQVIPAKVEVATFFEFDAKVNVTTPVNVGSPIDPVAAVNLSIRQSVKDLILRWEKEDTDEWTLNGRGEITLREAKP